MNGAHRSKTAESTAQLLLDGAPPRHLTGERYVIGRSDECDVLLPESDGLVSRRHAVLERDPATGDWTLIDLGSRNGSFVGGERVRDRRPLCDGDEVRIGASRIHLVLPRPPATASPAVSEPGIVEQALGRRPVAATIAVPVPPPSSVEPAEEFVFRRPTVPAASALLPAYTGRAEALAEPPTVAAPVTIAAAPERSARPLTRQEPPPGPELLPRRPLAPVQTAPAPAAATEAVGAQPLLRVLAGAAGATGLLSLFLPWAQVHVLFGTASVSYVDLCRLVGEAMRLPGASSEPRLLFTFVPLLTVLALLAGGLPTSRGTQASLLLGGGVTGVLAGVLLYAGLSNGAEINLSGLLGIGFFLFVFASLGAIAIGARCLTTAGDGSSHKGATS